VLVAAIAPGRDSVMHTLYGNSISGNCWKPAVMLHARGLPFRWIEVDILRGESRTAEFLKLNPNGRVPLLVLPDGRTLAESNAMLLHLGEGTPWLPSDPYPRAKTYEWLFFEQYSHEPYVATVRFWVKYAGKAQEKAQEIVERTARGHAALGVMEKALASTPFLVGQEPTLADIALYSYTHVAPEGGFSLEGYPAIRTWLDRVRMLPGVVPMPFHG
jgi:glutathione S-transferase